MKEVGLQPSEDRVRAPTEKIRQKEGAERKGAESGQKRSDRHSRRRKWERETRNRKFGRKKGKELKEKNFHFMNTHRHFVTSHVVTVMQCCCEVDRYNCIRACVLCRLRAWPTSGSRDHV